MGTKQQEEVNEETEQPQPKSLRSRAFQFVSGISTILLNPISNQDQDQDQPSTVFTQDDKDEDDETESDDEPNVTVDGPDTSSFAAFLYSLIASPDKRISSIKEDVVLSDDDLTKSSEEIVMKVNMKKKGVLSRGKQAFGKVLHKAAKISGFNHRLSKSSSSPSLAIEAIEQEGIAMETLNKFETTPVQILPETSEPSMLLSEKTRGFLYSALPVIVQGRKWMLLYSTWRHGISLSTLYRRSMLWPGLSLLVVGDRKGAVFGGLVESPLRPSNKKRYQGTNSSFVFSNKSGQTQLFNPTGINRYFTLCSSEYLAMGGGSHFALYLDSDLLNGSSSSSETYGNPCLAESQYFQVKQIELWGFVYASKFDELVMALSEADRFGICRQL